LAISGSVAAGDHDRLTFTNVIRLSWRFARISSADPSLSVSRPGG
jgi:hypothetical protein